MTSNINWDYPPPRQGLAGAIDRFIGPGATPAEVWLQFTVPIAACIALPIWAVVQDFDWSLVQCIIAGWFAFDMAGGIITNATSTAKRWYHRDGQGSRDYLSFILFHVVYLFLIAWLFRSMDWAYFVTLSIYLLGASVIILRTPLYLQRPVAFTLLAVSFVFNSLVFSATAGLEWFIPCLFLKLLVSHLLQEEPYRPSNETV